MGDDTTAVTRLLQRWQAGDPGALEAMTPLIYQELRRIAASHLRREKSGHTLQPTDLLHEAFVRLIKQHDQNWKNRAHFFGAAANLMRQILVDHARAKACLKRGGGVERVGLDEAVSAAASRPAQLIALDDAMKELEKFDARKCRVIELRFFGGMSVEETAEVTGVSASKVSREQRMAEAWLQRQMLMQA
ncbi:RNA polymerase, sigma-24 subunit, ECF subfamily [Candidatus Sulfopaludibacter sp. SbA4]|nr:RNA polymerase, sigma-24 subunit, ECF subfamily [Candidatus Sulfopaludibacter sp. SbA4]